VHAAAPVVTRVVPLKLAYCKEARVSIFRAEVSTSIEIEATPARVWVVRTDLSAYGQWNPMIVRAEGTVLKGRRLKIRFAPRGSRAYTFFPKLLVVEPPRELRWLGFPRFPGVLDTEHYFVIQPAHAGTTTIMIHGAVEYGLLTPVASLFLSRTARHFEAMNQALKSRAAPTVGSHPLS
jgi:hypothetical protein